MCLMKLILNCTCTTFNTWERKKQNTKYLSNFVAFGTNKKIYVLTNPLLVKQHIVLLTLELHSDYKLHLLD